MEHLARLLFVAAAIAEAAQAQNFNIDFTDNMATTVPPASYGAALNQPGVWNPWDALAPLSPLDLNGAPTSVIVAVSGFTFRGTHDAPGTVGDDELLIDDYITVGSSYASAPIVTFQSLAPGLYDTFSYGWFGLNPSSTVTCIGNEGSTDPWAQCGGPWGGTLAATPQAWGRHRQWVSAGGSLSVKAYGCQLTGVLNGIQVRHVPNAYITTYCTGKLNSAGCTPLMSHSGYPSAADLGAYSLRITAYSLVNFKPGLMLYSLTGRAAVPFQGGTLCLATPAKRTPAQDSGGFAPGCNGSFSLRLSHFANGLLGGSPHPALLVPGTLVNCQWWARDTGTPPNNSQLSNALEFVQGY